MNKEGLKKNSLYVIITLFSAVLSAISIHYFVNSASFAPIGVDGICVMLQEITKINAGYFVILINLPLTVVAWFVLKRKYVIYTMLFSILSSAFLILLESINFPVFQGEGERIIATVFSGVMMGIRTGAMLRIGASSGGIDIIASIVQKKRQYIDIEKIITFVCYVIIVLSYFVYKNINSVLLSFIQMFIFDRACARVLKDNRNAVEFKIVTKHPDEIRNDIIFNLKHGATIVESKGMFTNDGSTIIFSVVNNRQIPEFLTIIKNHPDTFVYYTDVAGVNGNFRWLKDDIAK